jgi:hypothetical protein
VLATEVIRSEKKLMRGGWMPPPLFECSEQETRVGSSETEPEEQTESQSSSVRRWCAAKVKVNVSGSWAFVLQ